MTKIVVSYIDRSGSTVLRNILKECNVDTTFYAHANVKADIICIRDLRDVITSHKRVYMSQHEQHKEFLRRKMTKAEIEEYFQPNNNRIAKQLKGLNKLLNDKPNIQIWKYESWFNNYDWIFNKLEKAPWNCSAIPLETREKITNKFSLKAVRKFIKKENLKNFSNWEKKHKFHGDHIWRGTPGSWKRLVPIEHQQWFTNKLMDDLIKWGYEKRRFSNKVLYGYSKKEEN